MSNPFFLIRATTLTIMSNLAHQLDQSTQTVAEPRRFTINCQSLKDTELSALITTVSEVLSTETINILKNPTADRILCENKLRALKKIFDDNGQLLELEIFKQKKVIFDINAPAVLALNRFVFSPLTPPPNPNPTPTPTLQMPSATPTPSTPAMSQSNPESFIAPVVPQRTTVPPSISPVYNEQASTNSSRSAPARSMPSPFYIEKIGMDDAAAYISYMSHIQPPNSLPGKYYQVSASTMQTVFSIIFNNASTLYARACSELKVDLSAPTSREDKMEVEPLIPTTIRSNYPPHAVFQPITNTIQNPEMRTPTLESTQSIEQNKQDLKSNTP